MTQECSKCKKLLPIADFPIKKSSETTRGKRCIACKTSATAMWCNNNPIQTQISVKKHIDSGKARAARLKKKYSISTSDYEDLLDSQQGCCAICRKKHTDFLHVDHSHVTGKVRGLLCSPCNRGIGFLQDDPDIIMAAAKYLF